MDELNGKLIACQILITGLIARVANEQRDPLRFLTEFRDEIRAVVKGVNIAGLENSDRNVLATLPISMRSCGRLGPDRLGATSPRSSRTTEE